MVQFFSGTIVLVQFLFLGAVYVVNKTSLSKPNFGKRNGAYGHFCLRMENGFVPRAEGPWFSE
jgi:hypothetical protein